LCKRYGIDLSQRTKHGALLDSMLLASVYVELLGERQAALALGARMEAESASRAAAGRATPRPVPLPSLLSAEDEAAHRAFVESLGPNAVWLEYARPG
jgi:DNA polymerase-3 subunit epsilon